MKNVPKYLLVMTLTLASCSPRHVMMESLASVKTENLNGELLPILNLYFDEADARQLRNYNPSGWVIATTQCKNELSSSAKVNIDSDVGEVAVKNGFSYIFYDERFKKYKIKIKINENFFIWEKEKVPFCIYYHVPKSYGVPELDSNKVMIAG